MDFKQLIDDDRAVSPVIGVILMVAITVILAAVIGTFVLGLGEQVQSTTPSASFGFDYTNNSANLADASGGASDSLVITHESGNEIEGTQLNTSVSGAKSGTGTAGAQTADAFSGSVSAGSQVELADITFKASGTTLSDTGTTAADQLNLASATVRVVWTSESGDNSATLGKWSGPEA